LTEQRISTLRCSATI